MMANTLTNIGQNFAPNLDVFYNPNSLANLEYRKCAIPGATHI